MWNIQFLDTLPDMGFCSMHTIVLHIICVHSLACMYPDYRGSNGTHIYS